MAEWISVKDRLPEKAGDVLVYMPNEDYQIQTLYYHENDLWENGYGIGNTRDFELTHWMPLPEPPQKEG